MSTKTHTPESKAHTKESALSKFGHSIGHIYEKHYKLLAIIPIVFLFLGIGQLMYQASVTGDVVDRGISLKGGTGITISHASDVTAMQLQEYLLSTHAGWQFNVRTLSDSGNGGSGGYIIETDRTSSEDQSAIIASISSKIGQINPSEYSIEVTGPTLGDAFFTQMMWGLVFAFVVMGVVIFIGFRNFVPSIAIILSAFTDLVLTVAIFNLLGFKLSTAGIAALLLVIGYSVDTNVLLTNHMLKRTGQKIYERIFNAFKTGWVMILTTTAAVVVGLLMTNSDAIREIMIIMLIGLIIDTFTTWFQNAGMLRWYLEAKQ